MNSGAMVWRNSHGGCIAVGLVLCASNCAHRPVGDVSSVSEERVARDESGRADAGVQSRCQFEGRADREARETAGPGAVLPNIRRVYSLEQRGEDPPVRVLICREVDTNYDGVKDVVRIYSDTGEPETESADSDFDGRFDTWMTFSRGSLVKTEVDTGRDGRPDEARFYLRGRLRRVQRDTNLDGNVDVWEIYDEGRLQRLGEDLDFDGHVDRWNRDERAVQPANEGENSLASDKTDPSSPAQSLPEREAGGPGERQGPAAQPKHPAMRRGEDSSP